MMWLKEKEKQTLVFTINNGGSVLPRVASVFLTAVHENNFSYDTK